MAGGSTEQERVWFAREVFGLFVKCFTNLKLYPHNHIHVREAMDAFVNRLRSYVQMHGVLRVQVAQASLNVDEQPVYEEENRTENLAFRLYVDGLRELSVQQGVTAEEAKKLAHVFYQVVVDPRADTTLLLWEAELTNIEYQAINSLSEAWEQPDFLRSDSLKLLKDMNRNVDDIVAQLTTGAHTRDTYAFELTDGAAEMDEMQRLAAQADGKDDAAREDIFEVGEDALLAFQKECGAWGPDRLLKVLVEASLDGLMLQPELVGRENVAWLLREAVEMALRTSDMDLLSTLLGRYEGELALLEEEEDEATFREVFSWLGQQENIDRLLALAKGQALGGPKAFVRILSLLGENGLKAAVQGYLDSPGKELRETLLAFVQENLHQDPKVILPLLDPERDAETVRAALFVVTKQRGLDMKLQELFLNTARKHKDPKVQEYATHMWRTSTREGQVATYMDALGAESKRDRVTAIQKMLEWGHRPALDKLKALVDHKTFLERDADEKALTLEAIRKLAGKASIAFLQQQQQRATTLFNRKAVQEVRDAAAEALARQKKEG